MKQPNQKQKEHTEEPEEGELKEEQEVQEKPKKQNVFSKMDSWLKEKGKEWKEGEPERRRKKLEKLDYQRQIQARKTELGKMRFENIKMKAKGDELRKKAMGDMPSPFGNMDNTTLRRLREG